MQLNKKAKELLKYFYITSEGQVRVKEDSPEWLQKLIFDGKQFKPITCNTIYCFLQELRNGYDSAVNLCARSDDNIIDLCKWVTECSDYVDEFSQENAYISLEDFLQENAFVSLSEALSSAQVECRTYLINKVMGHLK